MGSNSKHMDFFKDFAGSIDEFRELMFLLYNGLADQNKYGDLENQKKLLNKINSGIVCIHPPNNPGSTDNDHMGEYIYANGTFYKTGGSNTLWEEWD